MSRARPLLVLAGLVVSGPLIVYALSRLKQAPPQPPAPPGQLRPAARPEFAPFVQNPPGFFPPNPRDMAGSRVFLLDWGKVWAGDEPDPAAAKGLHDGRRAFLANDRACLAAALVGTGFGGPVNPAGWVGAHPSMVVRIAGEGATFVPPKSRRVPLLQTNSGGGGFGLGRMTRHAVYRAGPADAGLADRFAGFVLAATKAVEAVGGVVTGGKGGDGVWPSHTLRYAIGGRSGELVLALTPLTGDDAELTRRLRLPGGLDPLRAATRDEAGPFLVVVVEETRARADPLTIRFRPPASRASPLTPPPRGRG